MQEVGSVYFASLRLVPEYEFKVRQHIAIYLYI